jgi:hypothetical protein
VLTTLANATDLSTWANQVAATADLPDLVRRLLLTTVDLNRLHLRAGEGTRYSGWDGVVECLSGNAYAHAGLSVWEMGTDARVKKKADADYATRTADPLGVDPAKSTFVFVTPRRWRDKETWAEEKAQAGPWREVRVIDADDLEGWLTLSPVVHAWISSKIGKAPEQVEDLATFWSDWTGATAPAFSGDLVVAGREDDARKITEFVQGQPGVQTVQADSQEEALAFIGAAVAQLPDPERTAVFDRALIVRDGSAWREIVACGQPLILLPTFSAFEGGGRARDKHHVLAPVGREVAPTAAMVTLSPVRRDAVTTALRALGMQQERAATLATQARRSLLSLRRRLALNPELQQPSWARPGVSRALMTAMLLGAWNEAHQGDREVVAQLANDDYDRVAAELTQLAYLSDPPLRRIGRTWFINSREDAWTLLNRYLTSAEVERFRAVCVQVFGAVDPALALPDDERWMASVHGRVRAESGLLRGSLADSLAMAATLNEAMPVAGVATGGELAVSVVRQILRQANGDETGDLWRSLDDVLPTLAEAAPDEFLAAVDTNVRGANSSLLQILEGANGTGFTSRWYHSGLLWAFERLAWSPEYLTRCALALAQLAHVQLDRRVGNSPRGTLRAIFLPWHVQTAASAEQRSRTLDTLRQREPDIAWTLMTSLLPQDHDIGSYTNAPEWRRWKPEDGPAVTIAEYRKIVRDIVAKLFEDAASDNERLPDIVGRFTQFPEEAQEEVLQRLSNTDPSSLAPAVRFNIGSRLRNLVSHHRRFPDAKWVMESSWVDRLAALYERWQPEDLVERYGWLFTHYPDLINIPEDDVQHYGEAQRQAQAIAAREIYDAEGFVGILHVAERNVAWVVARAISPGGLLRDEDELAILGFLGSEIDWRRLLAMNYVHHKNLALDAGQAWVDRVFSDATAWRPRKVADFLRSLPANPATWQRLDGCDTEVKSLYWQDFPPHGPTTQADYEYAARQLIGHGRAWTAADMLAMASHGEDRSIDPMLVLEALETAVHTPLGGYAHDGNLGYDIGRLLDLLNAADGLPEERLAGLEWAILPLFRFDQRPMKVLHRQLAADPQFFVDVMSLAFRGENDESRADLDEDTKARAQIAYYLLDGWRIVPGTTEDGSVDAGQLNAWVDAARQLLAASGRIRIGEQRTGHVLKYAQPEADGSWPPVPVRDLIERVGSDDIETGFLVEERNSRGVWSKDLREGGAQERTLAEKYRGFAEPLANGWPRTAAMLRRIADSYDSDARQEDESMELRENLE